MKIRKKIEKVKSIVLDLDTVLDITNLSLNNRVKERTLLILKITT